MKKLIAIILALVMALAMTSVAFAAEGSIAAGTKGSITINKYNDQNVYSIYRMLELKSFNTAGQGTYSYTITSDWEDFFINGEGAAYVTIDNGYVTWKIGVSDTVAPEFAKKALAYADENNISADASSNGATAEVDPNTGFNIYKFEDLELGYYLVDSTMGALCGLTTTNPNASINAKNGEPTMVKHVKSGNNWGSKNTASIGDTVEFHVDITVAAGAEGYIVHDAMEEGLTFKTDSVTVEYDGDEVDAIDTPDDENTRNYTVVTNPTETLQNGLTCDFEVQFTKKFCDTLEPGKELIVSYSAVLNEKAFIGDPDTVPGDDPGNINTATLEFGEDHFTTPSKVVVNTYAFDLVKTDAQYSLLPGAFFQMYDSAEGGNPIKLTKVENNGSFYYRPAGGDNSGIDTFEVVGGMIRFQGFAPGDYYFEETKEPAGYNKLTERAKFTLPSANKDAIFNDDGSGNMIYSSGSGFHITNQSGTMLPETGGIGTLLFTVLGGSTALGTGVVLVTKKRMSKIEDDED